MIQIILTVTDEEFERLNSTGLLNMDMAGVLWQQVTLSPAEEESEGNE